jgi:hypothetical protein
MILHLEGKEYKVSKRAEISLDKELPQMTIPNRTIFSLKKTILL